MSNFKIQLSDEEKKEIDDMIPIIKGFYKNDDLLNMKLKINAPYNIKKKFVYESYSKIPIKDFIPVAIMLKNASSYTFKKPVSKEKSDVIKQKEVMAILEDKINIIKKKIENNKDNTNAELEKDLEKQNSRLELLKKEIQKHDEEKKDKDEKNTIDYNGIALQALEILESGSISNDDLYDDTKNENARYKMKIKKLKADYLFQQIKKAFCSSSVETEPVTAAPAAPAATAAAAAPAHVPANNNLESYTRPIQNNYNDTNANVFSFKNKIEKQKIEYGDNNFQYSKTKTETTVKVFGSGFGGNSGTGTLYIPPNVRQYQSNMKPEYNQRQRPNYNNNNNNYQKYDKPHRYDNKEYYKKEVTEKVEHVVKTAPINTVSEELFPEFVIKKEVKTVTKGVWGKPLSEQVKLEPVKFVESDEQQEPKEIKQIKNVIVEPKKQIIQYTDEEYEYDDEYNDNEEYDGVDKWEDDYIEDSAEISNDSAGSYEDDIIIPPSIETAYVSW
jgi:hypothetical protein